MNSFTKKNKFIKNLNRFNSLNELTFKMITIYFMITCVFYAIVGLNHALYGTIVMTFYFIFMLNRKENFSIKLQITIVVVFIYFSLIYILYVKNYDFLLVKFMMIVFPIVSLRMYRYAIYTTIAIFVLYVLVNHILYFRFDVSSQTDVSTIYSYWYYFTIFFTIFFIFSFTVLINQKIGLIIEDLEQKNKQLKISKAKEQELQLNKENLFASLSHEIRTPLHAINGITDLLIKQKDANEEQKKMYALMNDSSNHLLALVNNFLDYTKINYGKITLNFSAFNPEESINYAFNLNKNLALDKKLRYELVKLTDLPQMVYSDNNKFIQILLNVINNAVKFTNKGDVKIFYGGRLDFDDQNLFYLTIEVKDTGTGIEDKILHHIYDKFVSIESDVVGYTNFGLGLSITKKNIDKLNGKIFIETCVDAGSTFKIILPLQVISDLTKSIKKTENSISTNEITFLIVDDSKVNLFVLSKQLTNYWINAKIVSATNGLEALEIVKNQQVDIVLMDLLMPILDGFESTELIRKLEDDERSKVPIIALTANVNDEISDKCFQKGMNDFLTKPFEINELINKIDYLLKNK